MSLLRKLSPDKFQPPYPPAAGADFYVLQYYIEGARFYRAAWVIALVALGLAIFVMFTITIFIIIIVNNPEPIGTWFGKWVQTFGIEFVRQVLSDLGLFSSP